MERRIKRGKAKSGKETNATHWLSFKSSHLVNFYNGVNIIIAVGKNAGLWSEHSLFGSCRRWTAIYFFIADLHCCAILLIQTCYRLCAA